MRDKADHRTAMDRSEIAIVQCQAVTVQKNLDVLQVVVKQMFVIDLIKRQVFDDAFHVEKLDDKHPALVKRFADAVGYGVKFLQVKENAGRVDHVEFPAE